jgi:undecaprenyl-diphosphatase
MPDLVNVILLGIIEGITEFLPISSTGHLLIAQHWLGARSDAFNIVIQAGAILAVTLIYWKRLWQLATGWRDADNRDYLLKLLLSFLITAVLGLLIAKLGFSLPDEVWPIAIALVVGGFWIFAAEHWSSKAAAEHAHHLDRGHPGRACADRGRHLSRHFALGCHHFHRHAGRHQ